MQELDDLELLYFMGLIHGHWLQMHDELVKEPVASLNISTESEEKKVK